MRAYHEEFFGPVAVVYRVADDEAAIALAGDSPYSLGGAGFADDPDRARRVASGVESGMVWISHSTGSRPELPFGGIKRSGYGRELSDLGMQVFVKHKLVCAVGPDAPLRGFGG